MECVLPDFTLACNADHLISGPILLTSHQCLLLGLSSLGTTEIIV